ncbi:MAG TPA: hypothetical protein VH092_03605, partial [Urbifossiella sp.]|nr:hypothetical protein [Urbifossiella sp.]
MNPAAGISRYNVCGGRDGSSVVDIGIAANLYAGRRKKTERGGLPLHVSHADAHAVASGKRSVDGADIIIIYVNIFTSSNLNASVIVYQYIP